MPPDHTLEYEPSRRSAWRCYLRAALGTMRWTVPLGIFGALAVYSRRPIWPICYVGAWEASWGKVDLVTSAMALRALLARFSTGEPVVMITVRDFAAVLTGVLVWGACAGIGIGFIWKLKMFLNTHSTKNKG